MMSYAMVARKDRSWINWLTPSYAVWFAAVYALHVVYLEMTSGARGSIYAYAYCYACYAAIFLFSALAYCWLTPPRLSAKRTYAGGGAGAAAWMLLALGTLAYLPVLLEFRASLLSPRTIYEQTRTGYGLYTFVSTMLLTLGYVLHLFQRKKGRVEGIAFHALTFLLIYVHGSKGQLLTLFFFWLMHRVYAKKKKFSFRKAVWVGLLMGSAIAGIFYAFSVGIDASELLLYMTGYSDYSQNAMMVIDDPKAKIYYGELLLEGELYSRVPRAIFPDKPKDFGGFKLAQTYYPEAYALDEGAPAFGIGNTYADFGPFAIVWIALTSAFTGWMASGTLRAFRKSRHPSYFLLFMFFAGVTPFSLGIGYQLPETVVLALAVAWMLRLQMLPKGAWLLPRGVPFRILPRKRQLRIGSLERSQ